MNIRSKKIRRPFLVFMIVAFSVVPLLDSMSCDEFAAGAPSPGSAVEIRCKNLLQKSNSGDCSQQQPDQKTPEKNVHLMCPICYSVAESAIYYHLDIPLTAALFQIQAHYLSLAQFSSSIDKPPQN